jgi:hypothetical protein
MIYDIYCIWVSILWQWSVWFFKEIEEDEDDDDDYYIRMAASGTTILASKISGKTQEAFCVRPTFIKPKVLACTSVPHSLQSRTVKYVPSPSLQHTAEGPH